MEPPIIYNPWVSLNSKHQPGLVTFFSKQASSVIYVCWTSLPLTTTRGRCIERRTSQTAFPLRIGLSFREATFGEQIVKIVPGRLWDRPVSWRLRSVRRTRGAICEQLVIARREARLPLLLLVEGHGKDEVGVVDRGIGQHEGHRDDRAQGVHFADKDKHQRRYRDDDQGKHWHLVRPAL